MARAYLFDRERGCELQLGGYAIVGDRSFRGVGGQISACAGVVGGIKHGQNRHEPNSRQRAIREFLVSRNLRPVVWAREQTTVPNPPSLSGE